MKDYDFLLVGAGLFNIVLGRKLTNFGYKCLIIDKRNHIGGNCYTEERYSIDVHMYGPHVFHTNNKKIWNFINKYSEFIPYQLNIKANYKGKIYSLPFNMNTFYELYHVNNPFDANEKLKKDLVEYKTPKNLEEQALSQVGKKIYKTLIKEYTEKQWNKPCKNLSSDIIKRLPVRLNWNNNYYYDIYQGLPKNGYTNWMLNIINGKDDEEPIEYQLNIDFLNDKEYWINKANRIIYCGEPDRLMNYVLGELEWRSLYFDHVLMDNDIISDQGCPIMNYTSNEVMYTRTIDQKYFTPLYISQDKKIFTYEFPQDYIKNQTEAYYPINDNKNEELYLKYVKLIKETYPNIILGGRLGLYKYLDMDDTIYEAMNLKI